MNTLYMIVFSHLKESLLRVIILYLEGPSLQDAMCRITQAQPLPGRYVWLVPTTRSMESFGTDYFRCAQEYSQETFVFHVDTSFEVNQVSYYVVLLPLLC